MENTIIRNDIHKPSFLITPDTVLFSNGEESITVAMAKNLIDHYIGLIALKDPEVGAYKKAKTAFESVRMILENKTPKKISQKDIAVTMDVITEIKNEYTMSYEEKKYNLELATICKVILYRFG